MCFCKSHYIFRASRVSPEAGTVKSSAWEANFACKQKSHYGEEDGEDKQHIRGSDHRVVGQLVWLSSHLVDIEAYGEDECRHAEQDHWKEGAREIMSVHFTHTCVHHDVSKSKHVNQTQCIFGVILLNLNLKKV